MPDVNPRWQVLSRLWAGILLAALLCAPLAVLAQVQAGAEEVVDIATRPGVTQRLLLLRPTPAPRASVVLLAGGHGGLQIGTDGSLRWGHGNFLVRTRRLLAEQGFLVVLADAPSDRQHPPFLTGFRTSAEHVADMKAVLAWVRTQAAVPVWLAGTSRGTESAAFVATELALPDGPDGVQLSSTLLVDRHGLPVQRLPLSRIRVPVLVVHHQHDGCWATPYRDVAWLMAQFTAAPRTHLLAVTGGRNDGDPCAGMAYHGYNGIETEVVGPAAAWMLSHSVKPP